MPNADTGDGAVAQLGERLVRNEEVRGSIPLSSTTIPGSHMIFVTAQVGGAKQACGQTWTEKRRGIQLLISQHNT
jgi:hypothetical protein